jgi:signal peptidase II
MPARYAALSLLVMAVDQAVKWLVRRTLRLHEEHTIVPGLVSLIHGRNRGLAFGLLSGAPLPAQALVLAVASAIILILLVLSWRALTGSSRRAEVALALIVGGAAGNLADRIRLGYVTDFVHLYWRQHDWPDFNVGDSAISVGVTLLLIDALVPRRPRVP